jgi:hypothetical protein
MFLAPNMSTSQQTSATSAQPADGQYVHEQTLNVSEQELEDQQFPKQKVRIFIKGNLYKKEWIQATPPHT